MPTREKADPTWGKRKKRPPKPKYPPRPPEGPPRVGGIVDPGPVKGWPGSPEYEEENSGAAPAAPKPGKTPPAAGTKKDNVNEKAILENDPRVIAAKATRDENIAAAKLARDAAIKRAGVALGLTQGEIARLIGYAQGDMLQSLAGRGMVRSGGTGAGYGRLEEDRARSLAAASQAYQDTSTQAYASEADAIRAFTQAYNTAVADAAAALADDPRYQDPEEEPEPKKTPPKGGGKTPPKGGGGNKPPKSKPKKKKVKGKKDEEPYGV